MTYLLKRFFVLSCLFWILVVVLMISFDGPALSAQTNFGSSQTAKRECILCHLVSSPVFKKETSVPFMGYGKEPVVATAEMCYSCHDGSISDARFKKWNNYQHPVNIIPSDKTTVPSFLPLDKQGRIYCGTCHSPHTESGAKSEKRLSNLRIANKDSELCKSCHVKEYNEGTINHPIGKVSLEIPPAIIRAGGYAGSSANKLICESCHSAHGAKAEKLLIIENKGVSSALCESCHSSNPSLKGKGYGMDSHPVNVLPQKASIPLRWKNGGKPLFGSKGYILCVTCHTSHNAETDNKLLVENNKRDIFCIECHEDNRVNGHPFNVSYKTMKPSLIRSDGQDRTTCSTCHIAHNAADDSSVIGTDGPILVASNKDSALCEDCHKSKKVNNINEAEEKGTHPVNILPKKVKIADKLKTSGTLTGTGGKVICNSCHNVHNAKASFNLVMERSILCLYCHWELNTFITNTSEGKRTHPVNIVPVKATISKDFLLAGGEDGRRGEILCLTCHKIHNAQKKTKNLVIKKEADFCVKCHTAEKSIEKTKHNLSVSAPDEKNASGERVETSGLCEVCHLAHGWARGKNDKDGDTISQLCISCHAEGKCAETKPIGEYLHPINKSLDHLDLETTLPLFTRNGTKSKDGKITCATCHNVHQWDPGSPKFGSSKNIEGDALNSFLRISNRPSSGLCLNCHQDKGSIVKTQHDLASSILWETNIRGETVAKAGICSACHIPHGGQKIQIWARKTDGEGNIISQLCKSCHAKDEEAWEKQVGEYTHPIGKALDEDLEIPLPLYNNEGSKDSHGNVTCATCHNIHRQSNLKDVKANSNTSFLRIANDHDSSLCCICHQKEKIVIGTDHDLSVTAPTEPNIQGNNIEQSGICSSCHLVHNAESGVLLWAKKSKSGKNNISGFCVDCHSSGQCAASKQTGKHSHPVDISPENTGIRGTLPLYGEQKNITCATCHNVHQWDPLVEAQGAGKNIEGGPSNSFLRIPEEHFINICTNCHGEKSLIMRTKHDLSITAPEEKNIHGFTVAKTGVCGTCHSVHNAFSETRLWAKTLGAGEEIMAKQCASCHADGKCAEKKQVEALYHPKGQGFRKIRLEDESFDDYSSDTLMLFVDAKNKVTRAEPLLPLFTTNGEKAYVGYLTCPSCHNPHQWDAEDFSFGTGEVEEGDNTNSFLRTADSYAISNSFCVDCHGFGALLLFKDYHQSRTNE